MWDHKKVDSVNIRKALDIVRILRVKSPHSTKLY